MGKTLIQILNEEGVKSSIDFQRDIKRIDIAERKNGIDNSDYLLILMSGSKYKKLKDVALDLQIVCNVSAEEGAAIALYTSTRGECPIIGDNDLYKLTYLAKKLKSIGYNVKVKGKYGEADL